MAQGSEDDEALVEKARYEGNYKDGLKHGIGKMVFPNGDLYEGEWFENKVLSKHYLLIESKSSPYISKVTRRRNLYIQKIWRHLQRELVSK